MYVFLIFSHRLFKICLVSFTEQKKKLSSVFKFSFTDYGVVDSEIHISSIFTCCLSPVILLSHFTLISTASFFSSSLPLSHLVHLSFPSLTQLNCVVQPRLRILLSQSPTSLDSTSMAPCIALVPVANFHIKLVVFFQIFYLNI